MKKRKTKTPVKKDRAIRPPATKVELEREIARLEKKLAHIEKTGISDKSTIKRMEEEIRLWADFAKSNPGPVLRCGKEGIVQVANPAAMEIFGIEKLEGVKLQDIIPDAGKIGIEKFIQNNSAASFSAPVGESFFQFIVQGVSAMDVVQVYGSDITRRKKLEEKLKETLAEMEIILENARVGICLTKDKKIVWGNSALEEMFKIKMEMAYGKSIEHFIVPENYRDWVENKLYTNPKQEQAVRLEGELLRHDRKTFWARVVGKAINPKDFSKGVIWVIEDFTQRKSMEDELREAKSGAEKATKLKDKFVSLVAHDLKSPFTAILGLLRILDSDKKHPLTSKQKELLGKVLNSGEGLVEMIDQLLNISRLQTGKMELNRKFLDGYFISVTALSSLEHLAAKKEIEIRNEIPRGMRIYADLNLFSEVINNLLSNAIKFCKKGDTITLLRPPGKKTTICIKDTGAGINGKMLSKLFLQEEKTTTTGTAGEKGTGLGLPFCHDIMTAHGGSITVESVESGGSAFYAELPMKRPRILVVDDDETIRYLFRECTHDCEFDIMEAEDGEKALRIIENDPPNLLITDIAMPVMDGWELLESVRRNAKTSRLPVIMLTSHASMESREKAFSMGANDFAAKPLVIEDLLPRVRRFVL